MKPLWAICLKMITEGIRMKITLIFILFLFLVIPSFPFVLKSDGTLKGQIQITLTYTLSLTSFFVYILAISLGVISFTGEITGKQVFLIDSKPVPRWQFILGKWLGIMVLCGSILLILGTCVYLLTKYYIFNYGGNPVTREQEKIKVREEIFSASRGVIPLMPEKWIEDKVEKHYQNLKKTGSLPLEKSEEDIRKIIAENYRYWTRIVEYKERKLWQFQNLPPDLRKESGKFLRIRYKLYTSTATAYGECPVKWEIGKGLTYKNPEKDSDPPEKINVGSFHELQVPTWVIDENGEVDVVFTNDENVSVYFPLPDGLELFYPVCTFEENMIKALLLIYVKTAFLVALGLFASTFLTFPVASLFSFVVLLLSLSADYLLDIVNKEALLGAKGFTTYTLWNKFTELFIQGIFYIIPNFGQYPGISYLSEGRTIEYSSLLMALLVLVLFQGGVLTVLGCYFYNRRELARPYL